MTMVLKVAGGALAAGAIGGLVAERIMTPKAIEAATAFDQWRDSVQIPDNVRADISGPSRTDAIMQLGLIGGATLAAGTGAFLAANRFFPGSSNLGLAIAAGGLVTAALGAGILGGSVGSYALR